MKYRHKFSHQRPKRRDNMEVAGVDGMIILKSPLTFWRQNYFFLILAHPVYKM